jgi:hypothetical protein
MIGLDVGDPHDDRCAPSENRMRAKLTRTYGKRIGSAVMHITKPRHTSDLLVRIGSNNSVMNYNMRMTPWRYCNEMINAIAETTQLLIDNGWQGHLMTFMFHQLPGGERQRHRQMQNEIEGVYASFITRMYRNPHAYAAIHPKLIVCPDWPVAKHAKKPLSEIITNDGLHQHGLLLIPPPSPTQRLKVSVHQHFHDNQSYYVRDRLLNRIDVQPFNPDDVANVTDYALKGLKQNRLESDEDLLILPKSNREITTRPYLTKANAE